MPKGSRSGEVPASRSALDHREQHHDLLVRADTVRQIRGHVCERAGTGLNDVGTERQRGGAFQNVQDRLHRTRVFAEFLARCEAEEDTPDGSLVVKSATHDGIGRYLGKLGT